VFIFFAICKTGGAEGAGNTISLAREEGGSGGSGGSGRRTSTDLHRAVVVAWFRVQYKDEIRR
jgi:hypothetical protein